MENIKRKIISIKVVLDIPRYITLSIITHKETPKSSYTKEKNTKKEVVFLLCWVKRLAGSYTPRYIQE
jgi:hypothetical protein